MSIRCIFSVILSKNWKKWFSLFHLKMCSNTNEFKIKGLCHIHVWLSFKPKNAVKSLLAELAISRISLRILSPRICKHAHMILETLTLYHYLTLVPLVNVAKATWLLLFTNTSDSVTLLFWLTYWFKYDSDMSWLYDVVWCYYGKNS